ncbi:MAG TPA: hypothetical protein ENK88_08090 [Campylobacterales bacterium]|nr:hypothetical protein [Campylobacterales bacterium]
MKFIFITISLWIAYFLAKFLSKDKGYSVPIRDQNHTKIATFGGKKIYHQMNIEQIYRGDVQSLIVAIDSPSNASFVIRKKSWIERLLLKFNLIKLIETGNARFDKLIYIASDESSLHKQLKLHETQTAILDFIEQVFHYPCKSIEIINENHTFYLKFNLKKGLYPKKIDMDIFTQDVVSHLFHLKKQLQLNNIENHEESKNYQKFQSLRFWIWFSAIFSFTLALLLFYSVYPFVIDEGKLFLYSLYMSLLVALYGFGYFFKKSRESSLRFSVSSRYFLGFLFSSFLTLMVLIKAINVYLDTNQAKIIVAVVDKKEKRADPSRYYLLLASTKLNDIEKVRVHSKFYNDTKIGDIIQMKVHNGAFGIRWVSNVRK